ncbi:helix-turn-helix domain-containing protein [Telmatospirillum siberiense]
MKLGKCERSGLTEKDRLAIELGLRIGCGIREIGLLINRDHSIISREIRRNGLMPSYDGIKAAGPRPIGIGTDATTRARSMTQRSSWTHWRSSVVAGRFSLLRFSPRFHDRAGIRPISACRPTVAGKWHKGLTGGHGMR